MAKEDKYFAKVQHISTMILVWTSYLTCITGMYFTPSLAWGVGSGGGGDKFLLFHTTDSQPDLHDDDDVVKFDTYCPSACTHGHLPS